jgi:hypothetical protein
VVERGIADPKVRCFPRFIALFILFLNFSIFVVIWAPIWYLIDILVASCLWLRAFLSRRESTYDALSNIVCGCIFLPNSRDPTSWPCCWCSDIEVFTKIDKCIHLPTHFICQTQNSRFIRMKRFHTLTQLNCSRQRLIAD